MYHDTPADMNKKTAFNRMYLNKNYFFKVRRCCKLLIYG